MVSSQNPSALSTLPAQSDSQKCQLQDSSATDLSRCRTLRLHGIPMCWSRDSLCELLTHRHWYQLSRSLRDSHGITASTVQELLNPVEIRTAYEWRQIGRTLSQTITRTLTDAEDADMTIRQLETNDPRIIPVDPSP